MKKSVIVFSVLLSAALAAQKDDSIALRRIYSHFLTESRCYKNLKVLTSTIGGRISGSMQADEAVKWAKRAMYEAGADTVILQPCMVPVWVRGAKEKCALVSGSNTTELKCTALGSSEGTGARGITAPVIEVGSFEALEKLGEKQISGKIVFYNVFFDQKHVRTGSAYGESVKYRALGASYAAKYGAVASVIRSMTSVADDEPHTGNMRYDTSISNKRIPAIALSYLSADLLHDALVGGNAVYLKIVTHCRNEGQKQSFNVVGQITGERADEFIITGGHLDSWDNGQGAHDDGAGVVQSIGVLAAFKKMTPKPKHSIRAVAFMNEENGLAGGEAYAAFAKSHNEKHLAAIETDAGGFTPRGFGVDTLNGLYRTVVKWQPLFHPYFADRIEKDGGGADLGPLEKLGVPCIGLEPDTQRYFDIHHTAADTFDKVNKRELELGGAAIASLIWLLDAHLP